VAVRDQQVTMIVGLTGGVASGKSAVADLFADLGVPVLDTDMISREIVVAGSKGLAQIRKRFGDSIINNDGTLDRPTLRQLVFADPAAREDLEAITHPLIAAELTRQSDLASGPYQIHVIPLLVETGMQDRVDRVLLVDCPLELQLARLESRDQISRSAAKLIIDAQTDRRARLAIADDVLINDAQRDELPRLVSKLHDYYQQLAKQGTMDATGLRLP
jgi:dephospho-CoA kinase